MPATRAHYEEVLADLIRRRDQLNVTIETLRHSMPPVHLDAPPKVSPPPILVATSRPVVEELGLPSDERGAESGEAEEVGEGEKDGRSRKEKKRQVEQALADPVLREKTDTDIAKICRVSRPFVAKIRQTMSEGRP
jgi:hypothetical protein